MMTIHLTFKQTIKWEFTQECQVILTAKIQALCSIQWRNKYYLHTYLYS